jgi:uncharacterized membrane protein YebE (DUF533 family)
MTPSEKNIVKSLIAVAWADGKVAAGEYGVIEGMLSGFDASDAEERELLDYASTPRTLRDDIPLGELSREDRELLFTNAALVTVIDGERHTIERDTLSELATLLEFTRDEALSLLSESTDG